MDVTKGFEYHDCFDRQRQVVSDLIFGRPDRQPEVTIVIPTFRRGGMLCEAIDSALRQDYPAGKFGVTVVDNDPLRDCETERLLTAAYAADGRVSYYKNRENLGLYGNWNRCFELSRSEWVVLLHDDDLLFDRFLPETMALLHRNTARRIAVLKPEMESWYDDGTPYKRSGRCSKLPLLQVIRLRACDYIFLGNYFGSPTGCLFHRETVLKQGGFNADVYPSADTMFMLRTAMQHPVFLYGRVLGARRIGMNVSLNSDVLCKCVDSRYSVVAYLIAFYRLGLLRRFGFAFYAAFDYYDEVKRELLPSFTYDFSALGITRPSACMRLFVSLTATLYRWFKKAGGIVNGVLFQSK